MNNRKKLDQLRREAERVGAKIVGWGLTRSGHFALTVGGPKGTRTVFAPGTTSDRLSIHRVRAKLKRANEEVS